MSFEQFKDQLRRNLDIHFLPTEFAALCHLFKKNIEGKECIDCNEFVSQFIILGNQEREMKRIKRLNEVRSITMRRQQTDDEIVKRCSAHIEVKLPFTIKEDAEKSAEEKLRKAAAGYNPSKHVGFSAFKAAYLEPAAFKEQCKQNFGVIFSVEELKALVDRLDTNGTGTITCKAFLHYFYQLAEEEDESIARQRHILNEKNKRFEDKLLKDMEDKGNKRRETKILWPTLPATIDDPLENMDNTKETNGTNKMNSEVDNPWSAPSSSLNNSTSTYNNSMTLGKKIQTRKPPVSDFFAPSKTEENLRRNKLSLVALYPKASIETKVILLNILYIFRSIYILYVGFYKRN